MDMLEKFKAVGANAAQRALQGVNKASTVARSKTGKQEDKYLVALDVGTEFVKALIGQVNEDDGTVEIIGVERYASRSYCRYSRSSRKL
jgi:hypothetical protein